MSDQSHSAFMYAVREDEFNMADSFDPPASGFENTTLPTDAPQEIREDRINKKLFEE